VIWVTRVEFYIFSQFYLQCITIQVIIVVHLENLAIQGPKIVCIERKHKISSLINSASIKNSYRRWIEIRSTMNSLIQITMCF
jgi:hypothetical protein